MLVVRFVLATLLTMVPFIMSSHFARAETILGLAAEVFLRHDYVNLKDNKAFVIGPGGYWFYESRQANAKSLVQKLLQTCNENAKRTGTTKLGRCEVVATGDNVTWSKKRTDIDWPEPLPQPDRLFEKAKVFLPQKGPISGVVLALHGANNSYSMSKSPDRFEKSWFEYFTSKGYAVYYPSVYDDVYSVTAYAGWFDPQTFQKSDRMNRLRLAQTKRLIATLHSKYPSLPLILWSHSAGGNIIQALSAGFDKAIVVGAPCGLGQRDSLAVPKSVPMLFVIGDSDEYVAEKTKKWSRAKFNSYCGRKFFRDNRKLAIVPGEGHTPFIWHQSLLDDVAKFLGKAPFDLKTSRSKLSPSSNLIEKVSKSYATSPLKKAFVIGRNSSEYSESFSKQSEANLWAVLRCNFAETKQYYPDVGRHVCTIYAEGDKVVGKK